MRRRRRRNDGSLKTTTTHTKPYETKQNETELSMKGTKQEKRKNAIGILISMKSFYYIHIAQKSKLSIQLNEEFI